MQLSLPMFECLLIRKAGPSLPNPAVFLVPLKNSSVPSLGTEDNDLALRFRGSCSPPQTVIDHEE